MCLLIAQPKGTTFSKHDLKDYLAYNGDGFGGCVAIDGALKIVRVVNNPALVLSSYYELFAGRKAMLHFRMATHGTTGLENCHPFLLTPDIACAHNGILDIDADEKTGASDTRLFCEHVLAPMARDNPDALFTPEVRALLASMIGESNRLMFFRADGKVSIVNEASGVTHRKAWLSNTYAWSSPERASWRGSEAAKRYQDDEEWWSTYDLPRVQGKPLALLSPEAAQDAMLANRVIASTEDADGGEDDDELSDAVAMTLEDVSSAWLGHGGTGVREWLLQNTEEASTLLSAWYEQVTPEQALALVVGDTDRAVEWLVDLVSEITDR
jgi:hypothetical protein